MTHPKRPARISPESRAVAYGAAVLAALIYAGAFATSYSGLMDLAQHMRIPSQLHYVVPAVVDLALVLFTMTTLLRRHRGESTVIPNLAAAFWVAVSIAGNVLHVLIPAGAQETWSAGTYAGASLAALMPIAALGASLVLENVLIARPEDAVVAKPAAAPKEAPAKAAATVVATSIPVKEPVKVADEDHPVVTPVQTRPAAAAVPLPAAKAPEARQSVEAPAVDRKSRDKAERAELASLVRSLSSEGLSKPQIAKQSGASLSTVKRILAEEAARELQPA